MNVRFLCAAGTLDDVMWPAISRKLERLGKTLDGAATELGADVVDAGVLPNLMSHFASNPAGGAFMAAPGAGAVGEGTDASDIPGGIHVPDIRAFFAGGAGKSKTAGKTQKPKSAIDLTESPAKASDDSNDDARFATATGS